MSVGSPPTTRVPSQGCCARDGPESAIAHEIDSVSKAKLRQRMT
jgi:hypothetical protein